MEVVPEALEYATLQTVRLIAEAQEKRCFYYKSYVGRLPTHALTLCFWDAHGAKYNRAINLQPIFSRAGISYRQLHAVQIQIHMDSIILAAENMWHFSTAKFARLKRRQIQEEPYPL